MSLDIKILAIYDNIDYYNRLIDLCKSYKTENHLEKTDKNKVLKIFSDFGYLKTKYKTNEKFYQIKECIENLEFYFHVSLRYGVFELMFGVIQVSPKEHLAGGAFGRVLKQIRSNKDNLLELPDNRPSFSSYNELKEILESALNLYEDFKKEFVKEYC